LVQVQGGGEEEDEEETVFNVSKVVKQVFKPGNKYSVPCPFQVLYKHLN
jgi:hypothetical protein